MASIAELRQMAEDDIAPTRYLIRQMMETIGEEIDHMHPDNAEDIEAAEQEWQALETLLQELA